MGIIVDAEKWKKIKREQQATANKVKSKPKAVEKQEPELKADLKAVYSNELETNNEEKE
jgi:transketolase